MANKTVIKILTDNGLKITPQRVAVLEVLLNLNTHPSADEIVDYLRISYPHISIGTVYKILEAFLKKGILNKLKTNDDIMRYDPVKEKHHHLYCTNTERVEDFYDVELDKLLESYFKKKKIPNFSVSDIKLQIVGNFTDKPDQPQ